MTKLLLKDFGIKEKVRNVKEIPGLRNKLSQEELETIRRITQKHGIPNSTLLEVYPSWLIDHYRFEIMKILSEISKCVVCANSIYAVCIEELNERRLLQTKALSYCELLVSEFNFLIDLLPIDTKKLLPYMRLIHDEILLIKGWRKSDKNLIDRILNDPRYKQYPTQRKMRIREEYISSIDNLNNELDEFYNVLNTGNLSDNN